MENRIRMLRKERKMTQLRLSMELEVSQETVSAYESGKYYPSYQTLLKLSKLLNSSIDYMMGLSSIRHPQLLHLSEKEQSLMVRYRMLDEHQKDCLSSFIDGLLA